LGFSFQRARKPTYSRKNLRKRLNAAIFLISAFREWDAAMAVGRQVKSDVDVAQYRLSVEQAPAACFAVEFPDLPARTHRPRSPIVKRRGGSVPKSS
jgi:hypothetical protein